MAYEDYRHKRYKGSGKANDTPLSYYMNRALKTALQKKSFVECKIMTDWPLIIGSKYASFCFPLKIAFPSYNKNEGVLHVVTYNGSAALQIQYSQPMILEKITSYFGYTAISKIVIHQKSQPKKQNARSSMPHAPRKLSDDEKQNVLESYDLTDIEDENLRAVLERLAISVHCKNSSKKQ